MILGARVASAAGDAGLRARVLQATEALERERPPVPLFAGVAGYARGILERDAQALVAAAELLESSSRPLLYAGAAEDAGAELARAQTQCRGARPAERGIRHLHRVRSDCRCPPGRPRAAPIRRGTAHRHAPAGKNGLGQPHRLRTQGHQPHRTGRDQPRRRHAAAPLPPHGEDPRPQRICQAGHHFPRPIGAAHARR